MASENKGVPQSLIEETDPWVGTLYSVDLISSEELKLWEEAYSYKGFNRRKVLAQLKTIFSDPKDAAEVIVACAMKGPQRAVTTRLRNGKTIESYGITASGAQGTEKISCQRIVSATADLAAFFLKRMNFPKRIISDCPGWLQFPSAGSILLPDNLRIAHIDFSRKFSPLIGGVFNEQIYQQMVMNAYLNQSLQLFEMTPVVPIHVHPQPTQVTSGVISSTLSTSSSATKKQKP
jgi:hypothetical protein